MRPSFQSSRPVEQRRGGTPLVVFVAAALLLLGGCQRFPPPSKVAFPDDPRVLHGAWTATVTGLTEPVAGLVHAPSAGRLLVWFWEGALAHQLASGGAWEEYEVDLPAFAQPANYDPTLEGFVGIGHAESQPRLRFLPVAGGPTTTVDITLPPAGQVEGTAVGSGRSFALVRTETGPHELLWWDSLTGAKGGSVAVGNVRDGLRTSSNGRLIALWNLDLWGVTLVDTAAPESPRLLGLGACRSNGLSEASADGRWFLFEDCRGNLRLADLSADELGSQAIGLKRSGTVTFAADTPEIVWADAAGVVHSYHAPTGTRTELARLSGSERDGFEPWYASVHLDRGADLLAVSTGRGTVRLESPSGVAQAVELPRLALSAVALDLTAGPIDPAGVDGYDFTGTLEPVGPDEAGEAFDVAGYVYADRLHEYLPAGAALSPAAIGPPRLVGYAAAPDLDAVQPLFSLSFGTEDRAATTFPGSLFDGRDGTSYKIVVARSGAAAE